MDAIAGNMNSSQSAAKHQDAQADSNRHVRQAPPHGAPNHLAPEPAPDASGLAARLRCTYETAQRISERLGAIADLRDRHGQQADSQAVSPVAAMHRLVVLEDEMRVRMDQFTRETADAYASVLAAHGVEGLNATSPDEHMSERISGMRALRARVGQLVAGATDAASRRARMTICWPGKRVSGRQTMSRWRPGLG